MIAKVRRNLRERGVKGSLERIVTRIREGYTEEELIILVKDLEEIPALRKSSGLRIAELGPRDLDQMYELNRRRADPDPGADRYFETSIGYGFHAFGAFLGEELVGYYWWVDRANPMPHPDLWRLGRSFELGPEDVYGSSLFLLEHARGGGRSGEFLFHVETSLRERGYRRLWGYVEKDNQPARWLYATRGYRPTWVMKNRRLVFLRWRRSSPVPDGS